MPRRFSSRDARAFTGMSSCRGFDARFNHGFFIRDFSRSFFRSGGFRPGGSFDASRTASRTDSTTASAIRLFSGGRFDRFEDASRAVKSRLFDQRRFSPVPPRLPQVVVTASSRGRGDMNGPVIESGCRAPTKVGRHPDNTFPNRVPFKEWRLSQGRRQTVCGRLSGFIAPRARTRGVFISRHGGWLTLPRPTDPGIP